MRLRPESPVPQSSDVERGARHQFTPHAAATRTPDRNPSSWNP
jgi:hypothetical protein